VSSGNQSEPQTRAWRQISESPRPRSKCSRGKHLPSRTYQQLSNLIPEAGWTLSPHNHYCIVMVSEIGEKLRRRPAARVLGLTTQPHSESTRFARTKNGVRRMFRPDAQLDESESDACPPLHRGYGSCWDLGTSQSYSMW
jgi:hypothetical protein